MCGGILDVKGDGRSGCPAPTLEEMVEKEDAKNGLRSTK
jgi:hypothetical protein